MNLAAQLINRVREKPDLRIVIIGDKMIDRWYSGKAEECQDGCQKFVAHDSLDTPGGAGNAHRSLYHWGLISTLHSYSREIPVKGRYITDDGRIVFRLDVERSKQFSPDMLMQQRDAVVNIMKPVSAVLLSDYDKGFLTPDFIQNVVALCRKYGIPCVADCKREPSVYEGCILKGNWDWATKWKMENTGVMTRGKYGPLEGGRSIYPSIPEDKLPVVTCINHVGAGDCFAAHLTLALACGFSLKDAAAIAHSAGRVYVQRWFSTPPHPGEIVADMDGKTLADFEVSKGSFHPLFKSALP